MSLNETMAQRTINEGKALAGRYSKYLTPMTEAYKSKNKKTIAPHMLATVAYGLNSLDEMFGQMDETTRAINTGNFIDYGYKLVTAILPNLVADQIVSVQPLKMRSGEIFYMNFRAGQTRGKISAGSNLISAQQGYQPGSYNYSTSTIEEESIGTGNNVTTVFTPTLSYFPIKPGTVTIVAGSVVASDNGSGVLNGSGVTSGTVSYTTGQVNITYSSAPANNVPLTATYDVDMEQNPQAIGQVDIDLQQTTVTAREYKLRAQYTLDAAWDLQQAHGHNADDELVAAVASIIRAEIDQSIMKNLFIQAAGGTVTFDATVPVGVSKQDHYDSMIHTFTKASNLIYQATRMVSGNFIIAGINAASVIEGMSQFTSNGIEANAAFSGPYVAGTLANRYLVVKNPDYAPNDFLVGYKGPSYLYAGYVWAPYRPLFTTPQVVLDDMIARRGLWTSGGQKMVNSRFYVKGTVTNYS